VSMLYIVHKIRKIKHLDQNELFTVPFSSDSLLAWHCCTRFLGTCSLSLAHRARQVAFPS